MRDGALGFVLRASRSGARDRATEGHNDWSVPDAQWLRGTWVETCSTVVDMAGDGGCNGTGVGMG